MTASLKGKIILVTGASRGIGRAAGEAIGKAGAHVILAARTRGGLEEADDAIREGGGSATLVPMDLTQEGSVEALAIEVAQRFGRLDGLIGAAGVLGDLAPVAHTEPKAWEKMLAVNVTANFRLIRAFDFLLRAAPSAAAVFVSDPVSHVPKAYWSCYAATKAALETIALGYAEECRHTGVKVNLVTPPPTHTRLRSAAMPGENVALLARPESVAAIFVRLMENRNVATGGTYAA
ncbi:MAG: SDR family NAD(P)-dependent oxidoreductase [Rickettsiales bacterium]